MLAGIKTGSYWFLSLKVAFITCRSLTQRMRLNEILAGRKFVMDVRGNPPHTHTPARLQFSLFYELGGCVRSSHEQRKGK